MERETELSSVGLNRYFVDGEAHAAVAEQSAAATCAIAARYARYRPNRDGELW